MSTEAFAQTTIEVVQATTLDVIRTQVLALNNSLKLSYLTTFGNWAQSVTAGRIPNTDPPKPPNAYIVGTFDDPTSGPGSLGPFGDTIIKWAYPAVGSTPVCDMPPIPQLPVTTAGEWKIGIAIPGGGGIWFQALAGDTTVDGAVKPAVSQDGVSGLFQKIGFPMGAGWFKKVG